MLIRTLVSVSLVALVATAGYASAGGKLRIIHLHRGQSVRIGNVKVIDVADKKVVTRTVAGPTVTGPTKTVTGPTTTVTLPAKVVTTTVTGPTVTVTVPAPPPPPPPGPKTSFGDGTYRVGLDIVAGTFQAPPATACYWERLSGFGGTLGEIIANSFGNVTIVTIQPTDVGFHSNSCGTWTKIS